MCKAPKLKKCITVPGPYKPYIIFISTNVRIMCIVVVIITIIIVIFVHNVITNFLGCIQNTPSLQSFSGVPARNINFAAGSRINLLPQKAQWNSALFRGLHKTCQFVNYFWLPWGQRVDLFKMSFSFVISNSNFDSFCLILRLYLWICVFCNEIWRRKFV